MSHARLALVRALADNIGLTGGLSRALASVPTCWRMLSEIAAGGRPLARITAAVNTARRQTWAAAVGRHGALSGVRVADKMLEGVTCIRLDASVVTAHSDKELAEANFKGYGHHPLLPTATTRPSRWPAPPNRPGDQGKTQGRVEPPVTRPASRATVTPQPKIKIHYAARRPSQASNRSA